MNQPPSNDVADLEQPAMAALETLPQEEKLKVLDYIKSLSFLNSQQSQPPVADSPTEG